MGIRLRKSVNIGGIRLNASKSGLGFSTGVKGFRVTKTAKGNIRTTMSIPGTGISYVKETNPQTELKKSIKQSTVKDNSVTVQKVSTIPNYQTTTTNKKHGFIFFCVVVLIVMGLLYFIHMYAV